MVGGFDRFKEWFKGFDEQYVIIGGTVCDLLISDQGGNFRATRDIDMVLIVEAVTAAFGQRFWEFIQRICSKDSPTSKLHSFKIII